MRARKNHTWKTWIGLAAVGWGARAGMTAEPSAEAFMVDGLAVDASSRTGEAAGEASSPRIFSLREIRPPAAVAPITVLDAAEPGGTGPMVAPRGEALAHLRSAELYAARQDWPRALEAIQQGVKSDPRNTLLLSRGAAVAALAKDYAMADDYYRQLLELYPDSLPFLNGRAAVLVRLRRFSEAQRLLDQAFSVSPQDLMTRFNRICLRFARRERGDDSPWDQLLAGELFVVANWLDADRAEFEELFTPEGYARLCEITLGPGAAEKLRGIAQVLRRANRAAQAGAWDQAAEALREAKAMGLPAMGLDMNLAQALFEQGRRDEARAILQRLVERYPGHPEVLYNYAYVLIQGNAFDQALAVLEQAQAAAPGNPRIAFARACMLAETGRMEEAWPLLVRLIQTRPAETRTWLQGEYPYLRQIHADPRYADLLAPSAAESR